MKLSPGYAPSFVHALRRSTNQWELIDSGRPSGYRGTRSGSTGELSDEVVVDEDTVLVRPGAPPRTDLVSYELWTPNAARQIDFVPARMEGT